MDVQVPPSLLFVLFVFCRRAIRAAFKNKTRAAILATHCMEEVEAVCDRVAILVSGQLRWLFAAEGGEGCRAEHVSGFGTLSFQKLIIIHISLNVKKRSLVLSAFCRITWKYVTFFQKLASHSAFGIGLIIQQLRVLFSGMIFAVFKNW